MSSSGRRRAPWPTEAAVRHSFMKSSAAAALLFAQAGRQSRSCGSRSRTSRAVLHLRHLRPSRLRAVGSRAGRPDSADYAGDLAAPDRASCLLRRAAGRRVDGRLDHAGIRDRQPGKGQGAGPGLDIRHARSPRLRSVGRRQVRRLAQGRGSENRGGRGQRHPSRDGRRGGGAFARPAPSLSQHRRHGGYSRQGEGAGGPAPRRQAHPGRPQGFPRAHALDRRRRGRGLPALPGKRDRDNPALRRGTTEFPTAGHSPYFEQAATFNAMVEAFLARER